LVELTLFEMTTPNQIDAFNERRVTVERVTETFGMQLSILFRGGGPQGILNNLVQKRPPVFTQTRPSLRAT